MSQVHQISNKSKVFFAHVLTLMGEAKHISIDNAPGIFYRFSAEIYLDYYSCKLGTGYLVSFAHYYKLNGDLMQAPEVMFLVIDERTEQDKSLEKLRVYPMAYQQADISYYEEFLKVEDNKTWVAPKAQRSCCEFCEMWFPNIREQQGI